MFVRTGAGALQFVLVMVRSIPGLSPRLENPATGKSLLGKGCDLMCCRMVWPWDVVNSTCFLAVCWTWVRCFQCRLCALLTPCFWVLVGGWGGWG